MRDGAEMVMVQAKVWKPGRRPRRLGRRRGRAGRRLIWGATTTQNANAGRVDEFRAGGRALAGWERSAKPAVNNAGGAVHRRQPAVAALLAYSPCASRRRARAVCPKSSYVHKWTDGAANIGSVIPLPLPLVILANSPAFVPGSFVSPMLRGRKARREFRPR
jgi:hypothetical protein